ncbi:ferritin-like domain-containing protein [Streptomyces sp. NPDC032940]|uniref:ferritin-like domain-containing protein n=1 Tax=Streptomyces sp. NPDC032940 TaxID=3155366 RepID=UPI0033F7CEFE
MSTTDYTRPEILTDLAGEWAVPVNGRAVIQWDYDRRNDKLVRLYQQGKQRQWDMDERLDWDHEVDPDDPLGLPDDFISIAGSKLWDRLPESERRIVRRHSSGWLYSQFLHSEQAALIAVGKILLTVEDLDSKLYAATQMMDEARHVEGFNRFLHTKIGLRYGLSPSISAMFEQAMREPRWDFGVLAAHILVENMGLATFGVHRERLRDPLARAFSAYVARDEARHVAFGRLLLRGYYPQLSEAELKEREDFVVEGCWALRDRYVDDEIWQQLGYGEEAIKASRRSPAKREFRRLVFMRIVPGLKEIGMFGPRVQEALAKMGVLGFHEVDEEALRALDDKAAVDALTEREMAFRHRDIQQVADLGSAAPSDGTPAP